MLEAVKQLEIIRPNTPDFVRRGLLCLLGGPAAANGSDISSALLHRMDAFHNYCRAQRVDARRQTLAMADGKIIAACLWVATPGAVASLHITDPREYPESVEALPACIGAATDDARVAGLRLVQAMAEDHDDTSAQVYLHAGCEFLARLLYLERSELWFRRPPPEFPPSVRLETYTSENHSAFCHAIAASYVGSLDCPRLSGLRTMDEVIRGHQAVGRFRPELWFLVRWEDNPVGVLLLAHLEARESLELVYLGLAPQVRGRGLGSALLHLALAKLAENSLRICSLAVDEQNIPAMRLYRKMRYRRKDSRRIYIKALQPPGV